MRLNEYYYSASNIYMRLNEQYDLLLEYYHKSCHFDKVIDSIIRKIKKNPHIYKDFYSGWVWNGDEVKCKSKSSATQIYEYPINVKFIYDIPELDAYVSSKDEDTDEIVVNINVFYLRLFDSDVNDIIDISNGDIYDDREVSIFMKKHKKLCGKDFEPYLRGTLQHEFLHILHGYGFIGKDILNNRKNNAQHIKFDDDSYISDEMQIVIARGGINSFCTYENLLYCNAPTEQEACINGVAGYLKGLDIIQAKMLIHKWEKRLGPALSNEKLIYRIAYDENILFFNKFHYYKECLEELKDSLDAIDDIYNNESDVMRDRYLGIIATAYRLEITGLFHTKPVVNDEFMKKCYNRNFIRQDTTKDIIKDIGWQMYSYFLKRMFEFQKSIYMQIYMFLQDRNLWR